jgi:crooked neck
MEEILGNYTAARNIFERWMSWKPLERGWLCYLKFEERMGEAQKHRELMYRFLAEFPRQSTYIKVSKYEQKLKNIPLSR